MGGKWGEKGTDIVEREKPSHCEFQSQQLGRANPRDWLGMLCRNK